MDKFISDELLIVIKELIEINPDTVFGGSLGLVLNGLLEREVKDLDILVAYDFKSADFYKSSMSVVFESSEWDTGRHGIDSLIMLECLGVKVDCFIVFEDAPYLLDGRIVNYKGVDIKTQNPCFAICEKVAMIDREKHRTDIEFIGKTINEFK